MALDLFKRYATDEKKEIEGVRFSIGPDEEDYLLIARMGNDRFTEAFSRLNDEYRERLDSSDPKVVRQASDEVMCRTMAESILVGWGANMMYDGQPLPYSVENAGKVLSHRDLREDVFAFSRRADNYRLESQAKLAKN